MTRPFRLSVALAAVAVLAVLPPPARARAAPGTQLENVELRTLAGGREKLLSTAVKANLLVFFRPDGERSLDALKGMAQCERDLEGRPIRWVAVVSGSAPVADVKAVVAASGIRMPVLLDDGDVLYDRLGIRMHPIVAIADGKLTLHALEPYRQIDYCDVVKTRLRVLIGEATQAELDRAVNPDASPLPGSDAAKKAMRDVHMARRLYELGQYEKAVKQAEKALEVAPVAQAWVVMARAYAKLGRCGDAAKVLDEALRLEPGNADVPAAKALCPAK
jgi:tetratricopeptide (TPR) repeat protein